MVGLTLIYLITKSLHYAESIYCTGIFSMRR